MNLALFDLDNTLLSGDTDFEWLAFLIEEGALPPSAMRENEDMDARYRAGRADVLEYVRFYLRPYPPHDMATLASWRKRFLPRMEARIRPGAKALVDSHRRDLAVIITATNRFLSGPIAAMLGVEHLIATEPQIVNDRFTGDVAGVPCMREGKISRLNSWLQARGEAFHDFRSVFFYSDSINDLPLLERVTHPVAVDPDARLRKTALEKGWKTLSLL